MKAKYTVVPLWKLKFIPIFITSYSYNTTLLSIILQSIQNINLVLGFNDSNVILENYFWSIGIKRSQITVSEMFCEPNHERKWIYWDVWCIEYQRKDVKMSFCISKTYWKELLNITLHSELNAELPLIRLCAFARSS